MNEVKEIRIINVGKSGISLFDINGRVFRVPVNGRLRVSKESVLDIIDYLPSRKLLLEKLVTVEGIDREMLLDSGLTDKELDILVGKEVQAKAKKSNSPKAVATVTTTEAEEVAAITYHNWLRNGKYDKIKESLSNQQNLETLNAIIEKNEKYNTEEIVEILSEVK